MSDEPEDPNVVSIGRIRPDVLRAHIAGCVASTKRVKGGGKDDDSKGSSSAELISMVIHNEAIIGTGKTTWPDRVCAGVVVGGIRGGPLREYLGRPFTGIVLLYALDGMMRFQASVLPVSTIQNMEPGERYEVWVAHKPMLQMLSSRSSDDELILMLDPSKSRLEVILGVSEACGEADGEDLPIMDTPAGLGLEDDSGLYGSFSRMLDVDEREFVPRHVLQFGASRLVAKLRHMQQKATDVCTLTVKTSKSDKKSAVCLLVGDLETRRSRATFYFDRETAEAAWADCRDHMANALPIDMVKAARAAAAEGAPGPKGLTEEQPRKKIRFETADEFNTFVMGGDDDEEEEVMPEPEQVGEEMAKTVQSYNATATMKQLTEFKFRLDYLLKALEPVCGDLNTVHLVIYITDYDESKQMALVDLIAPTTQSRGVVAGRFVSVQE